MRKRPRSLVQPRSSVSSFAAAYAALAERWDAPLITAIDDWRRRPWLQRWAGRLALRIRYWL